MDYVETQSSNDVLFIKIRFRQIDASNYYELQISNSGWASLTLLLDGKNELLRQENSQAIHKILE